ncbi:DUF1983 domain-containing protein [Candidatus Symbiopectobacterium sp. NZEC127]|uniref:phage tail tip fiber protein n=1 Tax=Candidatus Symbiopectobacterium sp. NZEC127 TaxID=2820472 RepID=UPI0022263816|nr:DUF1983 domain-containing protein [Candidatus Symbiopectobacterium sp. NZEC127]MCW2484846.1 DUF1983 domain-containing protein [Candidatus Symbiopectobacterium sp. NZEC127]
MSTKFRAGNDQPSLAENVETLTGQRGDGNNRAVTYSDLVKLNLANIRRLSGGKVMLVPRNGIGGGFSKESRGQKPTRPTSFKTTGGFAYVLLEWDMPNYRGHALTEIYRSSENNLANVILIASSAAGVYGDPVDPGWKGYYWIRHINTQDEPGPYNDVHGCFAQTQSDVGAVVKLINEEINASPLIKGLSAKIDVAEENIDSVSVEVDKETQKRIQADKALGKRVDSVGVTLDKNSAAVQLNTEAIARIDDHGSAAYQAQWSAKAQAGDIKAGIGIVARKDANGYLLSQVAVSASQFFVFDPNNPHEDGSYTFPFIVNDSGKVVINELVAKDAVMKTLSAQKITADSLKAGIEIKSPLIKTARIESGNFTVDANGNVVAKNAKIEGEIIATSGSFTGKVNAESGVFRGTVYAKDGEFSGTVYADRIVGDICSTYVVPRGSFFVPRRQSRQITLYYDMDSREDMIISLLGMYFDNAAFAKARPKQNWFSIKVGEEYIVHTNHPTPPYTVSCKITKGKRTIPIVISVSAGESGAGYEFSHKGVAVIVNREKGILRM